MTKTQLTRLPIESQGERRRNQFIRVASHIIVNDGPGAVDHASVAEIAECTRTLVYRYFPKRADLMFAVLEACFRETERLSDSIVENLRLLADVRPGYIPPALQEAMAYNDRVGPSHADSDLLLAGLTLLRTHDVVQAFGSHEPEFREMVDKRWAAQLRELGMGTHEVDLAVESYFTMMHHLFARRFSGELAGDELIDLYLRLGSAIVTSLLPRPT